MYMLQCNDKSKINNVIATKIQYHSVTRQKFRFLQQKGEISWVFLK